MGGIEGWVTMRRGNDIITGATDHGMGVGVVGMKKGSIGIGRGVGVVRGTSPEIKGIEKGTSRKTGVMDTESIIAAVTTIETGVASALGVAPATTTAGTVTAVQSPTAHATRTPNSSCLVVQVRLVQYLLCQSVDVRDLALVLDSEDARQTTVLNLKHKVCDKAQMAKRRLESCPRKQWAWVS
jgi:hypothetical protein